MSAQALLRRRTGTAEVLLALALYGVYEVVRGLGGEDFTAAMANTARIVEAETHLGLFWEKAIQDASLAIPGAAAALGAAYMALHFLGTTAFLVWAHRARPDAYPLLRTAVVASTGLALVGYLAFPAAPPRLAELGFRDAVTDGAGVNLSSDLLGALYNPVAAVPSLHFGYAVIVGAGLALFATSRALRWVGAAYPLVMLYVIVATGNHFFLDALAGGVVVAAGWWLARRLTERRGRLAPSYA
jgi:hypothetical protein